MVTPADATSLESPYGYRRRWHSLWPLLLSTAATSFRPHKFKYIRSWDKPRNIGTNTALLYWDKHKPMNAGLALVPSSSLLSALRHCCARPDPRCTTWCAAPASLARTGLLSGRLGVDVVCASAQLDHVNSQALFFFHRGGSQPARDPCAARQSAGSAAGPRVVGEAGARGTSSGRGRAGLAAKCRGRGYLWHGGRRRPSAAQFLRSRCPAM